MMKGRAMVQQSKSRVSRKAREMEDYYNSTTNDILDGMVVNNSSEPSGEGAVVRFVIGNIDNDDDIDGGGSGSHSICSFW